MYTPHQALRAYQRLMRPYYEASAMARLADAGFDAGEFSGPAHDRMDDDHEHRTMRMVCARMGVTPKQVEEAMYESDDRSLYAHL